MKKLGVALAVFCGMLFGQAHASIIPGWERPIRRAEEMKIIKTEFGFENVTKVSLTLTQQDETPSSTGITIEYVEPKPYIGTPYRPGANYKMLKIINKYTDFCGSTVYQAALQLKQQNLRFYVQLVDHSKRICKDNPPGTWEAFVTKGYGFCGTFDATMHLSGEPEEVVTPERLK